MAIARAEILEKIERAHFSLANALEKKIDSILREKYKKKRLIIRLKKVSAEVVSELVRRYRLAGWNVHSEYNNMGMRRLVFESREV